MSESGQESDAEYMYESSSDLGNEEDAMYEYEDESYPEPNDLGSNLMNENLVSTGKSVGYQILNYESVEKIMKSVVVNVGSVLDVDYQQAQLLLTSQRWDEEKLIESYFANPEELCKESGIDLYEKDVIQRRLDSRMNVSPFLCKICYDDASTEGFCLGCNHQFCISCYEGYLHNQVSEGPLCVMARCPEFKCTQAIPPIVYHTLLNSTEDKITYQRYALRQFIEANKSYRYCPAPNCECISVGSGETHVICTCGYQYCFHCTAEDHRPCSCTTLSKWVDKCNNDSETANWMAVNTKPCPKCISRIEKNQGCNHMTCRQCKHEFCWLCFGDWKGHTACNRYNADGKEVGEEENSIQKKKRDLERYMHYYKRYQNHEIAEKFAVKQRMKTELLLKTLQEQDCLVLQDAQCVREATEQVISCRRVLKYTYVIGYYMEDTAVNKQLFERHQEMLEENTERLQEFIETKNLKNLDRTELINYTRITERFRNSLLDDIHDEAALPPPPPLKRQTSNKSSTGGNKGKKTSSSSSSGGLVATAAAALNSFISSPGSAFERTTGPVTRSRAGMNA